MSDVPHNQTDDCHSTSIGSQKLDPQPDRLARAATRGALPALARRLFGRADAAAVLNISEDVLRHMRATGVGIQPRLAVDGYRYDAKTVERIAAMRKLQRMLALYRSRS